MHGSPHISMGSLFSTCLGRQRESNHPLAGRHSKGTFPRIVSNSELLKMRPDFTGHILEMKTINRFLQASCHAEAGYEPRPEASTEGGKQNSSASKQGREGKSFHRLAWRMQKQLIIIFQPIAKQCHELVWEYLNYTQNWKLKRQRDWD